MTFISSEKLLPRLAFTPGEAAVSAGISRTRIFQAIREKKLTARKAGKATIIEMDELARFLRSLPACGRQPEAGHAA
jgi:hypothetical protein